MKAYLIAMLSPWDKLLTSMKDLKFNGDGDDDAKLDQYVQWFGLYCEWDERRDLDYFLCELYEDDIKELSEKRKKIMLSLLEDDDFDINPE